MIKRLGWEPWFRAILILAVGLVAAACSRGIALQAAPDEYEGSPLEEPAPDFELIDQTGQLVALSDFRGQVVVLAFLDSQCVDLCPLIAIHLRSAHQALGDEAESVVFLGVNANPTANTVHDVAAATRRWQLDEIANWHFLSGSAPVLEAVWQAYGVGVVLPTEEGEQLQHTPGVFIIDPAGQQRWYISTPFDETGMPVATAPLSELVVKQVRSILEE